LEFNVILNKKSKARTIKNNTFDHLDPQKYVATVSILIAHSPVADNWNLKSEVYQPQSNDDEDYLRTPRIPSLVPFKDQADPILIDERPSIK